MPIRCIKTECSSIKNSILGNVPCRVVLIIGQSNMRNLKHSVPMRSVLAAKQYGLSTDSFLARNRTWTILCGQFAKYAIVETISNSRNSRWNRAGNLEHCPENEIT